MAAATVYHEKKGLWHMVKKKERKKERRKDKKKKEKENPELTNRLLKN